MEDKKPIDGAEYISLEDAKRLKLPFYEGLAAGFPSPAIDYQHESVAQTVCVFIDTNHFREDLPQYWNMTEERLLTPSNSTQQIVQTATKCMERIFRQGFHYKRAGVIVMGISPDNGIQTNFIDYDSERHEKMKRLDEAMDKINREYGSETIVLGSQQYTARGGKGKAGVFKDSIKHDFRSPCYTTRWSDIPEAT